jgi:hypothetical protein
MINKKDIDHTEFKNQVAALCSTEHGSKLYCIVRAMAGDLMLARNPDIGEIGSSDVSGEVFNAWKSWHYYAPGGQAYSDKFDPVEIFNILNQEYQQYA